jgi:predicted dehydrogenase
VEDVTTMWLNYPRQCTAIIHSSWLDPRKVREMTIVGSKRMIVYDDCAPLEKIRIYDSRVERPPHYDTFAEFHYAYHYGDVYSPYVKQEEPLQTECQHFLDCINQGKTPLTDGNKGMELVRILEASSESLKQNGAPIHLANHFSNGNAAPPPLNQRAAARPQVPAARMTKLKSPELDLGTKSVPAWTTGTSR